MVNKIKHIDIYYSFCSFFCILGGEFSELFRNRKGFFSINVQVVVNAKLEIIDIVARWPGSTHDATIFDNSRIKALFEMGALNDGLLLADSAYPNLPYIMTPLHNPTTAAEHIYNEAQIRSRSVIERFFGIWKREFAVLSIGTRFRTVERTLPIIVAIAVLHNIIQQETEQNAIEGGLYDNVIMQMEVENNENINNVRQQIIEYFDR